ncbi:hypothetical protein [Bacillus vallismortis]|uniref:hypothetical protein n=1 Tax=Bacillus vallismortis TaxID=72361 RepID=UPI00227F91B7|nr:hypothetical protein [Bacillus vallismortis]MCY7919728.1 hypothetical protein [Bacillus vallismortis]MEC1792184.1 hypothetical protein [Bacillus vallismortis]
MKIINERNVNLYKNEWRHITVDYVNYPNVWDSEGYREPIEVLYVGNNVTLDVSSGYLSLSRLHYNEAGKPELGEKAQELIEFETGIDISLSAEEVASMTVLEFMTKLAEAKGGAK